MQLHFVLGIGLVTLCVGNAYAYTAYVSNEKSNTVSKIDTSTWKVTKTIRVGQRPRGIGYTKDQKYVLVACGDDDTIQLIDTGSDTVVDSLPSGPDPEFFTAGSDGKLLYVANENDNTVTIIDIARRTQIGEVQVGVEPEGMVMSPDGKILINTSETTNMAHFIDPVKRESWPAFSLINGRVSRHSRPTAPSCGCRRKWEAPLP
jgi:YVTN family beta-propeller protein